MASMGLEPHVALDRPVFRYVTVTPELNAYLVEQVTSPARIRGGLLFGYLRDQTLHLLLASTAGISNWYPPRTGPVPDVDLRFALGWSEAVLGILGPRVDWVGHWFSPEDQQLKTGIEMLPGSPAPAEFGELYAHGLFLITGFNDGELAYSASYLGSAGLPQPLPVQVSHLPLEGHRPFLRPST